MAAPAVPAERVDAASFGDDSLAAKLARFEAGLGRRATEPPPTARTPAVPRLGDLTPDSPAVDAALQLVIQIESS